MRNWRLEKQKGPGCTQKNAPELKLTVIKYEYSSKSTILWMLLTKYINFHDFNHTYPLRGGSKIKNIKVKTMTNHVSLAISVNMSGHGNVSF